MAYITVRPFGRLPNGQEVRLFIMSNEYITAHFLDYGAILQRLLVKGKDGTTRDVVLGYSTIEEYYNDNNCFGATAVGRYCNRIRGGNFELGGNVYMLEQNDNGNTLHGGPVGFSKRVFSACVDNDSLSFSLFSEDGEMGFPGNLQLTMKVTLEGKELKFTYAYICDKDCPVSITNHSYFNLNGAGDGAAAEHKLTIHSEKYCKQDTAHIALAPPVPVEDTPFDFRNGARVADGILSRVTQLRIAKGYDHCYAMDTEHFVTMRGEKSKIVLDIYSDYPAMHFYDGNGIGRGEIVKGKSNLPYRKRYGMAFEPEYFPNSPNEPFFPSSVAKAGIVNTHYIKFAFSHIYE